jgi:hypothetical protein
MAELITAIEQYARWIYLLLVLVMVREVVAMWRAGRERDVSLFSLEREAATGRAVQSLVTLFLLMTIGVGVYAVANVLAPALPQDPILQVDDSSPLIDTPLAPPLPTVTRTATVAPTERPLRIVTAPPRPTVAETPGDTPP